VKGVPPLVVAVLDGAAERLDEADTPSLDQLAGEGRLMGVRLVDRPALALSAGPLLAAFGADPATHETSPASYLALELGAEAEADERFCCADFVALFRDTIADPEPGPWSAAELDVLLTDAGDALQPAGFRLVRGVGAHHLAVAPRASIDPRVPSPRMLLGRPLDEPTVRQHAFAHRVARETLDRHEINVVRRDLGRNGADMIWFWGPGGSVQPGEARKQTSAFGADPLWRGVCKALGIKVRDAAVRELASGVQQALRRDKLCFVLAPDDATVGALAEVVAKKKSRLLVIATTAGPFDGPVPALLWGAGIESFGSHPFRLKGAAEAGDPLEPGHGLLAYAQRL